MSQREHQDWRRIVATCRRSIGGAPRAMIAMLNRDLQTPPALDLAGIGSAHLAVERNVERLEADLRATEPRLRELRSTAQAMHALDERIDQLRARLQSGTRDSNPVAAPVPASASMPGPTAAPARTQGIVAILDVTELREARRSVHALQRTLSEHDGSLARLSEEIFRVAELATSLISTLTGALAERVALESQQAVRQAGERARELEHAVEELARTTDAPAGIPAMHGRLIAGLRELIEEQAAEWRSSAVALSSRFALDRMKIDLARRVSQRAALDCAKTARMAAHAMHDALLVDPELAASGDVPADASDALERWYECEPWLRDGIEARQEAIATLSGHCDALAASVTSLRAEQEEVAQVIAAMLEGDGAFPPLVAPLPGSSPFAPETGPLPPWSIAVRELEQILRGLGRRRDSLESRILGRLPALTDLRAALEASERELEALYAELGGLLPAPHGAAPPTGAAEPGSEDPDIHELAERMLHTAEALLGRWQLPAPASRVGADE